MGNRTKTIVVAATAVAMLATPAAASADVDLEPGATFYEDGSCNEADGTPGQSQPDGQCFTIADYDEMFSYQNLDTFPSYFDPDVSVAVEAGLDPTDETPASERELGDGVTDRPHRFSDMFAPVGWERNPYSRWGTDTFYANGLPIRLA